MNIDSSITAESTVTLTNKIISASDNTITNLTSVNFAAEVIKANLSEVFIDHTSIASAKIVKEELALKANASAISNINNTADLDKPISTATQAALNLKESIAGAKKQAIKMAIIFSE